MLRWSFRHYWKYGVVLLLSPLLLAGCALTDLKAKAGLQVVTDAVPATVYLDGKSGDKTPYVNKDLKAGEYTLEIRPDDATLANYQTKISLKKGVLTFVIWKPGHRPETSGGVTYEMEPLRGGKHSELSITTIPDGAILHVDGEAKGFAPVLVENISPGEHEYEVQLPSYETQKNKINVLEGYRMDVTVKLAKLEYPGPSPVPSPKVQGVATDSATLATPSATTVVPSPSLSAAGALLSGKPATATSTPQIIAPGSLPKPKVLIQHTGFKNANGQEVLRVRLGADPGSAEIGQAPVGSEYPYLKQTLDGWYKISFSGREGWVSQQYAQLFE